MNAQVDALLSIRDADPSMLSSDEYSDHSAATIEVQNAQRLRRRTPRIGAHPYVLEKRLAHARAFQGAACG